MPEPATPLVVILLSWMLGMLGVLIAVLIAIARRLARIDAKLATDVTHVDTTPASPSPEEPSAGDAFETFLGEDPTRRTLPKSEQFAAYRRWRQQHGLNWSNS